MYWLFALLAFVLLTRLTGPKRIEGSMVLAIVWPIAIAGISFYAVKKYVLRLGGPSERLFPVEVLAIVLLGAAGLIAGLYLQGDPFAVLLVRGALK